MGSAGAGEGEDQGYLEAGALLVLAEKPLLAAGSAPRDQALVASGTRNSMFELKESSNPIKDRRKAWRAFFLNLGGNKNNDSHLDDTLHHHTILIHTKVSVRQKGQWLREVSAPA